MQRVNFELRSVPCLRLATARDLHAATGLTALIGKASHFAFSLLGETVHKCVNFLSLFSLILSLFFSRVPHTLAYILYLFLSKESTARVVMAA